MVVVLKGVVLKVGGRRVVVLKGGLKLGKLVG